MKSCVILSLNLNLWSLVVVLHKMACTGLLLHNINMFQHGGSSQAYLSRYRAAHPLNTQVCVCKISPHCGFHSYLAAPVGTLRPGSGPCWAAGAEPRCPLRGGTGAGSRNGTPKPGQTLKQYCSKASAQARRMQPAGTRQGPGLEEPSRRSWVPCRGHLEAEWGCLEPRGRCCCCPLLRFAL